MTKLEEKAQGYANNQMRCYKCSDNKAPCRDSKCVDWHRCFKGYKQGYTEALRWRDVNMELPDINTNVLVKDDRLGNLSRPSYWISWLNKKGYFTGLEVAGSGYVNHPTHWRPIETI